MVASSWRGRVGKVRTVIGNSMGGLRGSTNLASWVVAGTLAYFLWVKPSRQLNKDQEERAALSAASNPYPYPVTQLQETSLVYGNNTRSNTSQD